MNTNFSDLRQQEIWSTIRALNDAWTQGRPNELTHYFHPQMVAITASDRQRRIGAAACIAGWKAFSEMAEIRDWHEIDPLIQVFGNAAVVSYYYEMSCAIAGQDINFSGRDMFFLIRENNRWWVVADQFSNYPG
jgi:hypothetical protein